MNTFAGLLGVLALCAVGELHAQERPASGQSGTICGHVVAVNCLGTTPPTISVAAGDGLVSVNTLSDAGPNAMRDGQDREGVEPARAGAQRRRGVPEPLVRQPGRTQ